MVINLMAVSFDAVLAEREIDRYTNRVGGH